MKSGLKFILDVDLYKYEIVKEDKNQTYTHDVGHTRDSYNNRDNITHNYTKVYKGKCNEYYILDKVKYDDIGYIRADNKSCLHRVICGTLSKDVTLHDAKSREKQKKERIDYYNRFQKLKDML